MDSKLPPWCTTRDVYLLLFIVEQNLVGTDEIVSVVTLSPLSNTHDAPLSPLSESNVIHKTGST